MTLLQLKALCQVADCGLNLSRTARALHVTQPAVTRMIHSLEQELGTELLVRSGTRIAGLTAQGQTILECAAQVLENVRKLEGIARDHAEPLIGVIKVGTTHAHAGYGLVNVVKAFKLRYPDVDLNLWQGTHVEIIDWVSKGTIDLAVSGTPQKVPSNVLTLDAYPIDICVIAPVEHPILRVRAITLQHIARYPIIAHDENNRIGAVLREKMAAAGLTPHIVVNARGSDIVLRYVAAGVGIALLPVHIFEQESDKRIAAVNARHIFPSTQAKISLRRNVYLRSFVYDFIAMVAPQWKRPDIDRLQGRN